MQFGRSDAGGFGNGLNFGLFAPMAADMSDCLTHGLVVGGSFGQRRRIENAIG